MGSKIAKRLGAGEPVKGGFKNKLKPSVLDKRERKIKKQAKKYADELDALRKEGYGLAIIVGNDGREKRFVVDMDDSFFIQNGKAYLTEPSFVTYEEAGKNTPNKAAEAKLTVKYEDGETESVSIMPEPDKVTIDSVTGIPKIYFSVRDSLPIDMRKASIDDPRQLVDAERLVALMEQAMLTGMQDGPRGRDFGLPDWFSDYWFYIATFGLAAVIFVAKEQGMLSGLS